MRFPNLKLAFPRSVIVIVILLKTSDSAPRKPRLSIVDWGDGYHEQGHQGEGTYAFGYDVDDPETGNTHYRNEERHANGSVTGSYGLVEPDGNVRVVHYIADANGFRVNIVNSEKPNAVFPAPTPALVPSNPTATIPESSERPSEVPAIPQQPEINNELPMEIPQGPSEQPESSVETSPQPSGEEAVESAQEEGNQVDQGGPSPPNTIVLPGGIVIEIPPDGPDDNLLGPQTRFYHKKINPAHASNAFPPVMKHIPGAYSPLQSLLIQPYSAGPNGYYGKRKQSSYYAYPNYNPYLSFMAPLGYYNGN